MSAAIVFTLGKRVAKKAVKEIAPAIATAILNPENVREFIRSNERAYIFKTAIKSNRDFTYDSNTGVYSFSKMDAVSEINIESIQDEEVDEILTEAELILATN